jgi:hypothetical protein
MTISRSISFQREPWRLSSALVISAFIHALLLSITLGGQTFGIPALKFPWQERRLGANDLQILLLPAQRAAPAAAPIQLPAETSPPAIPTPPLPAANRPAMASTVTAVPVSPPFVPPAPAPTPVPAPAPEPTMASKRPDVPLPTAPAAPPIVTPKSVDAPLKPLEQDRDHALELARLEQEKQAAEKLRQSELIAEAQLEATRQEQLRQDATRAEQAARVEAVRLETERQELAKQELARTEAARVEAAARAEQVAKAEAARREAERQELARQEDLRREHAKQEELARQELARQELQRAENARLDAARKEAIRQDLAKQAQLDAARQAQQLEAARQDATRQEAARQEAAKQEAARLEQTKREQAQIEKAKQEAEREERLRAIGRQLNEEAAQRDAALKNPSRSLLPTVSGLRRGWLFGRADPNTDLVLYAEAMSKKFELNMAFDMLREVVKQRHVPPMVTIAVRADGSVEKVTFVVSSGVQAIDDAIRKVVTSYAPYGAFAPALARQYDVIEIRRTWVFDTAIRLQ